MTKSRGSFGIVFRMKDKFNFLVYYINIEEGYKKVFKVVDGVYTTILSKSDGGFPQDNWFKVRIQAVQNNFEIRTGDDKKYANYRATPVVFTFNERTFSSGQVGLFTNGNEEFFADNFTIKPKFCQTEWKVNTKIHIMTDSANFFDEQYDMSFNLK